MRPIESVTYIKIHEEKVWPTTLAFAIPPSYPLLRIHWTTPARMSLRTYVYTPQPPGVDVFWASAAHVHHYLICSASERARIMADVQNMEPGQPFSVLIVHPCLRKYLFLSTVETDDTFLARLTRHFIGDLNTWYYQSYMASVSF